MKGRRYQLYHNATDRRHYTSADKLILLLPEIQWAVDGNRTGWVEDTKLKKRISLQDALAICTRIS